MMMMMMMIAGDL